MTIGPDPTTIRLRTALRDLVALATIPAAWVGREPSAIAAGLADLLIGSLDLDFAFVRLRDPEGGDVVEVTRGDAWRSFPEWLQHHLSVNGHRSLREVIPDVSGRVEPCCGIVIPIGVDSEGGLVAAASGRSSFPDEIDRLLLSVAANQAATACQNARLLYERRRAEEALREARNDLEKKVAERTAELLRTTADLVERDAKIRRLIDANIIGIFIGDFDGLILEANGAFLHMVGYDREDLIAGRVRWSDLTPPEWRDRTEQALQQVKTTGIVQAYEKEYFRKDGSRVPVLAGATLFEEGGDKSIGFVIDLTERKRAAEALREVQTELVHANRAAALGQLTASIAHEVNQPISGVLSSGLAALRWLETPDLEAARRSIERVIRDATRAGDVINGLRALVKKAPPRTDSFDVNAAVREVISLTHGEAAGKAVSVRLQLDQRLPHIRGDRVQLQQVVLNLVINAIDAISEPGDRPRDLLITTTSDDADCVLVAVQDTGPGVADPERVFEAFYTTKPAGLGMGLSICRSIVEAHGGQLSVAANVPYGAIFQFTVPAHGNDR